MLKSIRRRLPPIAALIEANGAFPPGHFYSPVVSIDEIRRDEQRVFDASNTRLGGIDLNEAGQLELLGHFEAIYPSVDAYFSPSWTAFQADRGRYFSVIVDGVSN